MLQEEEFSISTERVDGCLVIAVRGELDLLTAEPLDQTLEDCQNGCPLLVDLSAVTFICSAGLHVLLKERPSGRPALVAPNHHVAKVLDIIHANRITSIFPDQASALESLCLPHLQLAV